MKRQSNSNRRSPMLVQSLMSRTASRRLQTRLRKIWQQLELPLEPVKPGSERS